MAIAAAAATSPWWYPVLAGAVSAMVGAGANAALKGGQSPQALMGKAGGGQKAPIQTSDILPQGGGSNMMGQGAPRLSQMLSGQTQPSYQSPQAIGGPGGGMDIQKILQMLGGGA